MLVTEISKFYFVGTTNAVPRPAYGAHHSDFEDEEIPRHAKIAFKE